MIGRRLTPKQIGEYEAKAFLGEECWVKHKQIYDEMLSYRKSLKGKPTDEQRATLELDRLWIDFYSKVLYNHKNTG